MPYQDGFTLEDVAAAWYRERGYRVHVVQPTTHRRTRNGKEEYDTFVDLFGVIDLLAVLRTTHRNGKPLVCLDQVTRNESEVKEKKEAIVDEGLWPVMSPGFCLRFWDYDPKTREFDVSELQYGAESLDPEWVHAFSWWPEDPEALIARHDTSLG